MKNSYIIIVLMAISFNSFAQKEGLNSIKKDNLKAYLTFFASDEMKGRETGTPSNDIAALYIKTNIMRIGLKPIPGTGDYFQNIPLLSKKINHKASQLSISNSNGEIVYSTDSILLFDSPSKTMEINGNVVFAGYAFVDSASDYNDLDSLDLKDKIVLIMTRTPGLVKSDEGKSMIQMDVEGQKIGFIVSKQPKAIFFVYDPKNKYHDAYESGISNMIPTEMVSLKTDSVPSSNFLIGFLTQHTADMLLKSSGSTLKQLQDKISETNKPASLQVQNITATLKVSIENTEFVGQNVIGIIEGSDPILKNECVIYTAHFDHAGVNDKGEVLNGADDDASGSMALIEIAQAFMKLKKKPLRTIVFAWVNGEEKGLLGSAYYTSNPAFPLKKTLLDINLDMIGRSKNESDTVSFQGFDLTVTQPNEVLLYTAHESSQITKTLASAAGKTGVKVIDMGKDLQFGSSDHVSFMEKGIPGLLFISGIHSDLHSTRDDVERLDFDKMEKVSKMVFLLGYNIANQRDRIKIDNPKLE